FMTTVLRILRRHTDLVAQVSVLEAYRLQCEEPTRRAGRSLHVRSLRKPDYEHRDESEPYLPLAAARNAVGRGAGPARDCGWLSGCHGCRCADGRRRTCVWIARR